MSNIEIQRRPSAKAAAFLNRQHRLLIDGAWVAPLGRGTIAVYDPATEEQIAVLGAAAAGDVDLAAAVARRAFEGGFNSPAGVGRTDGTGSMPIPRWNLSPSPCSRTATGWR